MYVRYLWFFRDVNEQEKGCYCLFDWWYVCMYVIPHQSTYIYFHHLPLWELTPKTKINIHHHQNKTKPKRKPYYFLFLHHHHFFFSSSFFISFINQSNQPLPHPKPHRIEISQPAKKMRSLGGYIHIYIFRYFVGWGGRWRYIDM